MDMKAQNRERLNHQKKCLTVALDLQQLGFKVDILVEPSTFDVLAHRSGELRFIEVKAGASKSLTPNEKEFKRIIESSPKLSYEIV